MAVTNPTIEQITRTLSLSAQTGQPTRVDDEGRVSLGSRWGRPTNHDAVVRAVILAAQRQHLDSVAVIKFKEILEDGNRKAKAYAHDICVASRHISYLERAGAYAPQAFQKAISEEPEEVSSLDVREELISPPTEEQQIDP